MKSNVWTEKKLQKLCGPIFENVEQSFRVEQSRAGIPVIIFTTLGGGNYPVMGMWWDNEMWQMARWSEDGKFPSISETDFDSDLDLDLEVEEQDEPEVA